MSKKKKNSQEHESVEQVVNLGPAGQPRRRKRAFMPAIGMMSIIVAVALWTTCNKDNDADTQSKDISPVAEVTSATTNDNPPPEHTTGGPSIYYPVPTYDFGNIVQGDKVTHTFIVQNYGDEPLKLIKAKGS